MVAGRAMIALRNTVIIAAFGVALGPTVKPEYSSSGGTLAIFIPTRSGLVIAADMRQSPQGVFCDGINKILIPKRPARTAVVVTGPATSLRDTSKIPKNELCAYLAQNPAPIDFGRSAVEFLESQNVPLDKLSGNGLTDKIYADILPYLTAGNLRAYVGTRLAQIIFAEFEPETKTSRIRALGVDIASSTEFLLQPLPVTSATTVLGDSFGPEASQTVLPFGEVEYFREQVLAGAGRAFLGVEYSQLIQKTKVSEIDPALAETVAINLIYATSKTTEITAAPSGIGGGISAVLLGSETKVLQ
jgi:hypothetical protein